MQYSAIELCQSSRTEKNYLDLEFKWQSFSHWKGQGKENFFPLIAAFQIVICYTANRLGTRELSLLKHYFSVASKMKYIKAYPKSCNMQLRNQRDILPAERI